MPVTEVSKILGARWNALNAEDKVPFEEEAREDKERFAREKKEYSAKLAAEGKSAAAGDSDADDDAGSDQE